MIRLILTSALTALALMAGAEDKPTEPKIRNRAASGNLIIHVFTVENQPVPVELTTDFGFMLFNLGTKEHPKPLYRVAFRNAASVQDFDTLSAFLSALRKLPTNSILYRYDSCSVSTSHDLGFDWDKFERTCKKLHLELPENPRLTCICPDNVLAKPARR